MLFPDCSISAEVRGFVICKEPRMALPLRHRQLPVHREETPGRLHILLMLQRHDILLSTPHASPPSTLAGHLFHPFAARRSALVA